MIHQRCRQCLETASIPSRLTILDYLKKIGREATVTEIVDHLSLRQPTVTFHINKLSGVGLLKKRKSGRQVFVKTFYKSVKCLQCILHT